MVNYKRLLETNSLRHKPVQQWYQSGRSKSWEKPIYNRMQKGFEKGYLLRKVAVNTLPRSSQKKQVSHECKEMLRHNKCQISYMFEEDKEGCDGETDCATSKEGNYCDVKTESMIAKHNKYLEEYFDSIDSKDTCPLIKGLEKLKWDRNIVQDYLDEDYISVNGTLYAIKVNSFKRFISFLDLIKNYNIVFKNWEVLRKRWKEVAVIHGLTEGHEEDLKACFKRTIDMEENPQEHDGSSKNGLGVVRENTREYFENVKRSETRFGVILDGNTDTDVDQMADQEDGANTSETDDFSGHSKSWEKPIHNRMQKGFEKGYMLREGAANTLPRSSQKK
ncbi:hypothetical protein Tco_0064034 [Tanacetum coccineum]